MLKACLSDCGPTGPPILAPPTSNAGCQKVLAKAARTISGQQLADALGQVLQGLDASCWSWGTVWHETSKLGSLQADAGSQRCHGWGGRPIDFAKDLEVQIAVGTAGLKLRADNRELQISVGTAGPQPNARSQWECQIKCQKECQNICQVVHRKMPDRMPEKMLE